VNAKKLKNGARVHLIPFAGTDAATVLVLFKVGSRYEALKVWGGSHYVEHLMFKGTKRRPNTVDISRELDRFGAEYNAYTGKDITGYFVKIAGEQVPVAIDMLHDMLFHSLYRPVEMAREKKVIIEEIKMYEENPVMHIEDLLEEAMFDGSTLGRNIAGTPQSMLAMKRNDVVAYRDAYYTPERMVIAIAGKVPENALALLEKTFGTVKPRKEPETFAPFGQLAPRREPRLRRQNKDVKQIQIALGFPTVGKNHPDQPAIQLLASILGGSMSSRLFIEVRERKGLCYHVRAVADAYEDVGTFVIRAGLDGARLPLASKTIIQEIIKIKKHGVTPQELRNIKDHVDGGLKLSLEDSSTRAEFYARQELFLETVETPAEKLAKYRKVTAKDIQRVANEVLDLSKLSIAAIGPYKTDAALLKEFPKL
jgi:predicted Zn-dependent peptidase